MAFSGTTKRSQNSRISCILPVISVPPSPSPANDKHKSKFTRHVWEISEKCRLYRSSHAQTKRKYQKRSPIRNNLVQNPIQQLEIQFPGSRKLFLFKSRKYGYHIFFKVLSLEDIQGKLTDHQLSVVLQCQFSCFFSLLIMKFGFMIEQQQNRLKELKWINWVRNEQQDTHYP